MRKVSGKSVSKKASDTEKDCARSFSYAAIQYKFIEYQ